MKLKNRCGNVIKETNDPVKQKLLKEQGYTEIKVAPKTKKPKEKTE